MKFIIFCFFGKSFNAILARSPHVNSDCFICIIGGLEADLESISPVEYSLTTFLGEGLNRLTIAVDDIDIHVLRLLSIDLKFKVCLLAIFFEM
jgi:hypothetical protein